MSTFREWVPTQTIEELFDKLNSATWNSNSATSGARTQASIPEGDAPIQLYSLATPNGMKVGIMLEELEIDYDAHVINIGTGDQFKSGFVEVNPNSKIPALVDREGPSGKHTTVFESGAIVLYLAEKFSKFIPSDPSLRVEVMSWIFWQMAGQGPMTGQFGHFFVYAPKDQVEARDYGVYRYGMEVMRLFSVLDNHLEGRTYMVGETYTIADIVCFPWAYLFRLPYAHPSGVSASSYLGIVKYKNVNAWVDRILARPTVQRGITVCKGGVGKPWLEKA